MHRMFWRLVAWWLLLTLEGKMAAMSGVGERSNALNSPLTDDDGAAEETQHTFCKIATKELQATANATITRQLKGVCTSKELKRATSAILREIQTLKDALIHVGSTALGRPNARAQRTTGDTERSKRKNPLEQSAAPNRDAPGRRFSYYWTISDAEQYLHEGVSLKSPTITLQETNNKYYLRLTITDRVVTVLLLSEERPPGGNHFEASYTIYVLSYNGKEVRLDATNAYSAPLRCLRPVKRDVDATDSIIIKLVIE